MVRWVVQTNGCDEAQYKPVISALLKHGINYVPVTVNPFGDNLFEIDLDDVVYGTTHLIQEAVQNNNNGVYYQNAMFDCRMGALQRNDMLNKMGTVIQIAEFDKRFIKYGMQVHVRPIGDLKLFAGAVFSTSEFTWYLRNIESITGKSFDQEELILVSPVIPIDAEYRIFIVDGKPVSVSMYRDNGKLVAVNCDERLSEFEVLCQDWLPNSVCVMDVADTPFGRKVIEFNTFNCAGWYAHNVENVVLAVTAYQQKVISSRPEPKLGDSWINL